MMLLEEIFKGSFAGIFAGVKDVVGTFKADPLEVLRLQSIVTEAELKAKVALIEAQTKINEIEAGSQDKFASRWRPAVGWICVCGLAYATLFEPLASWVCLNSGLVSPPQLNLDILMPMVTGLLGLAGMRTYEKVQNNK